MTDNNQISINDDISVVICGEAGHGIQTVEQALTGILKNAGYNIFATKEYMSRVRGGANSTEIRLANEKIRAYVDRIDILIPLSKGAIEHLQDRISKQTIIFAKQETTAEQQCNVINIDFLKIAEEIGDKIYENSVAIGLILGILDVAASFYQDYFNKRFAGKGDDIVQKNISAAQKGYAFGADLIATKKITHNIKKADDVAKAILINGAEAIAFGAIAGGCNFISSYPMSPSTGVLVSFAAYSHDFNIIVEQAEDEINAINMALGAWYAGARAMVTTSGGGFALMSEGLSLAGITETPVVLHLGQRPGPATGLPTRTEQGDLNLALYSGHGEFPRVILAPGNIEQAFALTQKAFQLADSYQIPVILLTDQFLLDSYYPAEFGVDFTSDINNKIVESKLDYKRYALSDSCLSPRAIPGLGEGIVCVDSDEHTEDGYITEDLALRTKMVDKRMQKLGLLQNEAIKPEFIGQQNYETLVICWGSNYHAVREALNKQNDDRIALLHFSQVYPLAKNSAEYFAAAKKIIAIENNATGQFAELLKSHFAIKIDCKILKYNGLPFSVAEIAAKLRENMGY